MNVIITTTSIDESIECSILRMCIDIYIYIYIYRKRERERERDVYTYIYIYIYVLLFPSLEVLQGEPLV